MAFVVTKTLKKPTAVILWYNEAFPARRDKLNSWIRSYAGVLSHGGHFVDPTTWQTVTAFDTEATYTKFCADLSALPEDIARQEYNTSQGITSTIVTEQT